MEAKKKRAEDEAAQIYAQFVESFEADSNTDTSKTFVRGETIVNNTIVHNNNNKEYDLKYNRSSKSSSSSSSTSSKPSSSSSSSSYSTTSKSSHAEKKKRSIDELKEELKRGQELRENRNKKYQRRDEYESSASTHGHNMDTENEHDTSGNLYVSNLAPQVTEQLLWREFGRYGSISSIKILWPKTEEEKRTRDRHCGFVVFTDRAAAERAKQELHGIDLYGAELRIAWANGPKSKSSSSSSSSSSLLGNPPSHHHSSSAPVRQPAPVPVPVPTPSHAPVPVPVPVVPQMIVVKVPADAAVKAAIDEVAVYIAQHKDGMQLEQLLMQREIHNPKYQFLHQVQSAEHTYYRWRLYSLLQGDTLSSWRATAFQMFIGGPFWLPPPPPNAAVPVPAPAPTHSMRHGGHGNTKRLPDDVRDEFEDMLRNLTVERNKIKAAMGFALDHAELSHEIVQIIIESLTLKETPIGMSCC
jgi:U2-associated protein SR140